MTPTFWRILDNQTRAYTIVLIAVSILLSAPALLSGYVFDDFFFKSPLLNQGSALDHYEINDNIRSSRYQAWYWYASNESGLRPFRPLSSLSLHIDFNLLGDYPMVGHLHSVVWFVLLLLGAFRLFKALLPERAAGLAMLIFALAGYHLTPVGWIAARHAVIGGTLSVWSALFFVNWLDRQRVSDLLLSLGAFLIGLFASEFVLGVAAFAVVVTLARSTGALRFKIASALPFVVGGLIYLALYKSLGYGALGDYPGYRDPFTEPLAYITALAAKGLTLLSAFAFGMPGFLAYDGGTFESVTIILGLACVVLLLLGITLCWRRLTADEQRTLKWLAMVLAFCALPALSGIPDGRAATLSAVAFTGIVATLLVRMHVMIDAGQRALPARILADLLIVGTCVLAPAMRVGASAFIYSAAPAADQFNQLSKISCDDEQDALSLNGSNLQGWMPYVITSYRGLFFRTWYQLADTTGALTVTRPAPDTLELDAEGSPLLSDRAIERLGELRVDQEIEFRDLGIVIKEIVNGAPSRVQFRHRDLASGNVCLLAYGDYSLNSVAIPPVGEELRLGPVILAPPE